MTPEEIRQHRIDQVALEFVEAAFTVVDILSMTYSMTEDAVPSLETALHSAEWAWQFSVAEPLRVLFEDTGQSPTEFDDIKTHFMMLIRRAHIGTINGVISLLESEDDEDDGDEPGAQLLGGSGPDLFGGYL